MPPKRGEVWLFELGMTAKTRQSPSEISIKASFLRPGAFLVQGVATYRKPGLFENSECFNPIKWMLLQSAGHLAGYPIEPAKG